MLGGGGENSHFLRASAVVAFIRHEVKKQGSYSDSRSQRVVMRGDGAGMAGWHADFSRGQEVTEVEVKQDLTVELLSTFGGSSW